MRAHYALGRWIACLLALVAVAGPSHAVPPQPEAYCFAVADSGDNLVFINKDGDGFVDLGATGTGAMEAIAFNPDVSACSNGVPRNIPGCLYAVTGDNFGFLDYDDSWDGDANDSEFIQISADVGVCTLPGGPPGGQAINDIDGLQFDVTRTDASTGTFVLWATARDGDGAAPDDVLFQIDPATGLVDTTPTPGFTGGATCVRISGPGIQVDIDDIAIKPEDGILYAVNNIGGGTDNLITIDPVTGAGTIVSFFDNTNPPPDRISDMEGLSFGADSVLYGTTGGGGTSPNDFWAVDTPDGDTTMIAPFPSLGDYEAVACLTDNLIIGTVFFDIDGDGSYEPSDGDAGFTGARVVVFIDNNDDGLVDAGDTQLCENAGAGFSLACPVTDPNGFYFFPVGQGNFVIQTDTATLPAGHSLTTDNFEEADFALTDFGVTDPDNDFGFQMPPGSGDLDITKTSDAGGPVVQGQTFTYTVEVTNNSGITHTGIRVTDTLPAGVTYVAQSTVASGPAEVYARDEFGAALFSNQDGSIPWAIDWAETNDDASPTAGSIDITGGELRFTGSGGAPLRQIEREVDLSGASAAAFSFDWRCQGDMEAGQDFLIVEASGDGGGSWTTLDTLEAEVDFCREPADADSGSLAYDISAFIAVDTRIRLGFTISATDEFLFFDDLEVRAAETFRDQFDPPFVDPGSFQAQDGSLNWATDWLEIGGETDGPDGGDIQVLEDPAFTGSGVLRIQDNDNGGEGVEREADLSAFSTATLSFDYRRANLDNNLDYVRVEMSNNGGASWAEVTRFEGPTNDAVYRSVAFDVSAFISSSTRVRFVSSPSLGGGDQVYFDNVMIDVRAPLAVVLDNAAGGVNGDLVDGVPPNLVEPEDGFILADGETLTITFRVTVDNPLDPYVASLLNTAVVTSTQSAIPEIARHLDPVVSGAVGDRVWLDMDGDGVQDTFEEGISNVEVSLRVDDDGTPGPSAGDSVYGTRITDSNGEYLFDHLPPGTYWVDVTDSTVPMGLVQSPGNLDQPTDPFGSLPTYTVATDEVDLTADFGYTSPAGTAIIGDYVWNDIDRDGIQDFGEVGLGGVALDLLSAGPDGIFGTGDDPPPVTTTTAADGSYLFTGLDPGEYKVEVTAGVPAGSTITAGPQSQGNDVSSPVTVIAGDLIDNVDFGYAPDACLPRIDFETDALGNPLVAGQVIDDEFSAWGVAVSFTVNAPSTGPAMIFDSANPTGGDVDLGSPNQTCVPPGPGVGTEGELGQPGENCAPLGNLLILSEDGDGSDPDDAADGGSITFTFANPTDIDHLEFLDAENTQDSVEVRGATTDNYRDQFDAAGYLYTNSDGSLDWTGTPWVETNDDGSPGGGSIFVNAGGELQLEGTGGNPERIVERPIDLTGATAAVLSYDWRCVGDMEDASGGAAADFVHIEISADGGTGWSTLQTKEGEVDMCLEPGDNDSGSDIFNLGALLDADPSDSRIRFRYTISAADEDFFVDDVEVRTPLFYGNLTAPGDNAYELFPVDTSGASELIITFPASGSLAAIGSCLASIRDKVWLDADSDGLFDLNEMGIAGVTVSLLSDPDGTPGSGDEVVVATTTTDANGNFSFDGLPDGDYVIQITDTNGKLGDLGGTTAPGIARELAVSIVDSDDVVGINFGYNAPGTIGDTIWNDANGDGVQDLGELGIGGVTVDLIGPGPDLILGNGDDVVLATETTAADGSYLFSGVAPGDYTVQVTDTGTVLTGYTQTGDPDATLDGEGTAAIALGGSDLSMDFGYRNTALPDVSGNVFEDLDIDGLDDGAGEPGFAGVTIELRDASGNVVATTTTNAAGDYSFIDVPAGDYTVAVTDEAGVLLGYMLTSGLDAIDITVVASNITGIDFGYVRTPAYASIGDQIWLDANADGIPGPNEAGLTGVVVELYDAGPDGLRGTADDVLVAATVTDADGRYLFSDLPAGNYYVDVIDSSLPESAPGDLTETTYPAGVNPSAVIALSEGEPYREADFGYVPASGTATLGDRVWYDADGDGLQDDGEIGIAGVVVTYLGAGPDGTFGTGDDTTAMATTDAGGFYLFTGLLPDDYVVSFDPLTLPAGVGTTPTNNGGNDVYNATVAVGDAFTHLDFGFDGGTFGTVGNLVWFDTNGDGDVDAGEDGVEDVTINLVGDTNGDGVWDPDGADDMFGTADDEPIVDTVTTDMNGAYLFEGLPDGDYLVDVTDIDGALVGLQKTSGTPDANDNSQDDPYDAMIAGGGNVLTADFGYTAEGEYGSISNFVWRDLDGDGLVDAGEPGIEGVSVEVWLDVDGNGVLEPGVDNLVRRSVTDANGEYEFKALPLGDYIVDVTDDFGVLAGFAKTTGPVPGNDDNSQDDPYLVMLTGAGPNNVTADFGYEDVAGAMSISGTVFVDADIDAGLDFTDGDGDGIYDPAISPDFPQDTASETLVPGARLLLYRVVGGVPFLIGSTVTDPSGFYSFDNLPMGDYEVRIDTTATIVDGFPQTTQTGSGGVQLLTLADTLDADWTQPNTNDSRNNNFGFFTPTTTTPVTLAYFEARSGGSFRWMTSTEVGNLGFNLYALTDTGLEKLNRDLIASHVVDSLEPQTYEFEGVATGATFVLEDVDIHGKVRHHGPFYLDEARGSEVDTVERVAWGEIRAQKAERKRAGIQARSNAARGTTSRAGSTAASGARLGAVTSAIGMGAGGDACLGCDRGKASIYPTAKLGVEQAGVYRVSHGDLLAAGIDFSGARSDWLALTSAGRALPIHVASGPVFGPGSYVEFIGEPVDTLYTKTNAYYLGVDPRRAVRAEELSFSGGGTPEEFYLETARLENQAQYHFASPTGDPWYAVRLLATSVPVETSIGFDLDSWVAGAAPVSIDVSLWGGTDFPTAPDHHLLVEVNASQVAEEWFDGLSQPEITFEVSSGGLQPASNTLTLKLPHDTGAKYDLVNYDHMTVRYPRAFVARADALRFESAGSDFLVSGLSSAGVVGYARSQGELTRLGVQISGQPGAYQSAFGAVDGSGEEVEYWVASDAGVLAPTIAAAGELERPERGRVDVVVVSHGDFIPGLDPWLERRRSEGFRIGVVDVADLYDRYSFGIVDPEAIRRHVEVSSRRGAKYLLLVGGDTYDYFDYLGVGSLSFVPSLYAQTDAIVRFAPVDPLFGDVDGDLIPDLAVGRWPVRTPDELSAVIEKTLDYANTPGSLSAVMASDGQDLGSGYSFALDSARMSALLDGDWQVEQISLDELAVADARQALIDGISAGPSLTSYFGHSSLSVWSFDGLFATPDVDELTNTAAPTIVTQWGCWNTYHVLPTFETLGNRLLLEPDTGAAAVLGASTLTEALSERRLGERVFERLGQSGALLGDSITEAKQDLAETEPGRLDVILGWTLLGDPTLTVVP